MSENPLEKLNRIKAVEREQLASAEPDEPTIEQFWTQPHGVRLVLIDGDVLNTVAAAVIDRGFVLSQQRINCMSAYPAHVGTLLSRRRRGDWSVAIAAWFSGGWTKVQETTGGTITGDVERLSSIARRMGRRLVAVEYDYFEESAGFVEASSQGEVGKHTFVTTVLTLPRNPNHHAEVVKAPNPCGLTVSLRQAGIDINAHISGKREMLTIVNTYDVA